MRPDEVEERMYVFIIDINEENRPGPLHMLKGKIVELSKGIALVRVGRQIEERSYKAGDGLIITPARCLQRVEATPVEVFS